MSDAAPATASQCKFKEVGAARFLRWAGEHLRARSDGGGTLPNNSVAACWYCNRHRHRRNSRLRRKSIADAFGSAWQPENGWRGSSAAQCENAVNLLSGSRGCAALKRGGDDFGWFALSGKLPVIFPLRATNLSSLACFRHDPTIAMTTSSSSLIPCRNFEAIDEGCLSPQPTNVTVPNG